MMTEKTKRKISIALKGIKRRPFSQEHRRKIGLAGLGRRAWNKGIPMSKEAKNKLRIALKGRPAWNKGLKGYLSGEQHYYWKDGVSKNREYNNEMRKKRRHKIGVSKKYIFEMGISKTKEYKKLQRQKRKALIKGGGKLTLATIQMVYEDNIKRFGTLTCYLCLQPIPLGKDHFEHKIPLSRGGTNKYNNLAIACQKCNCRKHTKTETEYRKEKGDSCQSIPVPAK